MTDVIAVKYLQTGDRFLWCGRVVELNEIEVIRSQRTNGVRKARRRLHVVEVENGTSHGLHYRDREEVERVQR